MSKALIFKQASSNIWRFDWQPLSMWSVSIGNAFNNLNQWLTNHVKILIEEIITDNGWNSSINEPNLKWFLFWRGKEFARGSTKSSGRDWLPQWRCAKLSSSSLPRACRFRLNREIMYLSYIAQIVLCFSRKSYMQLCQSNPISLDSLNRLWNAFAHHKNALQNYFNAIQFHWSL